MTFIEESDNIEKSDNPSEQTNRSYYNFGKAVAEAGLEQQLFSLKSQHAPAHSAMISSGIIAQFFENNDWRKVITNFISKGAIGKSWYCGDITKLHNRVAENILLERKINSIFFKNEVWDEVPEEIKIFAENGGPVAIRNIIIRGETQAMSYQASWNLLKLIKNYMAPAELCEDIITLGNEAMVTHPNIAYEAFKSVNKSLDELYAVTLRNFKYEHVGVLLKIIEETPGELKTSRINDVIKRILYPKKYNVKDENSIVHDQVINDVYIVVQKSGIVLDEKCRKELYKIMAVRGDIRVSRINESVYSPIRLDWARQHVNWCSHRLLVYEILTREGTKKDEKTTLECAKKIINEADIANNPIPEQITIKHLKLLMKMYEILDLRRELIARKINDIKELKGLSELHFIKEQFNKVYELELLLEERGSKKILEIARTALINKELNGHNFMYVNSFYWLNPNNKKEYDAVLSQLIEMNPIAAVRLAQRHPKKIGRSNAIKIALRKVPLSELAQHFAGTGSNFEDLRKELRKRIAKKHNVPVKKLENLVNL